MSEIALAPELLFTEPGLVAGKVAVVTGAAQGIGYEIAAALSKHGAKVIIADLDQAKAEIAAESLGGGDVVALACNVTDEDAVSRVADSAVSQFGSLDIWVNNAGADLLTGEEARRGSTTTFRTRRAPPRRELPVRPVPPETEAARRSG